MKMIGTYTLRGQGLEGEIERIRLFDGRFDTGYKVTSFRVFGSTIVGSGGFVAGKLGTTDTLGTSQVEFWNAADVREIAWSQSAGATDGGNHNLGDFIVDPDNFIVEDLFVYVRANVSADKVNYIITMEKYDTTDSRGALAMIRNNAQNVLGDN